MPRRKKKPFVQPNDSVSLEPSSAQITDESKPSSAAIPEESKYKFDDLLVAIEAFNIVKTREILESNPSLVSHKTAIENYSVLDVFVIIYEKLRPSLEVAAEILMILNDKGFKFQEKSPNGFYPIDFLISKNHGVIAGVLREFGAGLDHKVTVVDFDYHEKKFIFAWDERYGKTISHKSLVQFITEDFTESEDRRLMLAYLEQEPYQSPPKFLGYKPGKPASFPPISTELPAVFQTQIAAASIKPDVAFEIKTDATITGSLKEYCSLILKRGIKVTCNTITHGLIFVSSDDSFDTYGESKPILHVASDEVKLFLCEDGSVEIVGDLPVVLD